MKLELYKNSSPNNTINKDIELIDTKEIKLKSNFDKFQSSIIITNKDIYDDVNYCKLIDRYYFVETQTIQNDKFIILNLKEDVIETFKDTILNSEFDIIEKSTAGNVKQNNVSYKTEQRKIESDVIIPNGSTIIMVSNGSKLVNGKSISEQEPDIGG